MEKVIKYVDTLEKSYKMISELECPKELNDYANEIKDITSQISCIVDLIDAEFHKEFYGEEE